MTYRPIDGQTGSQEKCTIVSRCILVCTVLITVLAGLPRTEAVSIVGSLLSYPSVVQSLPLLLPSSDQLTLVSSQDLQVAYPYI